MTIKSFTFNGFAENTYVLADPATRQCVVIDPGCYTAAEQRELQAYLTTEGLTPVLLLNTHAHIDHVLGNAFVLRTWPEIPFLLHPLDLPVLRAVPTYAGSYGFAAYEPAEPTGELAAGQQITFGQTTLDVRFAPGHSPGHVVFYHPASATVIGGDVLFRGSIGRTDLPGGDHETLLQSIRTELFTLPDPTVVYPGHGPATTVGEERRSNPFFV